LLSSRAISPLLSWASGEKLRNWAGNFEYVNMEPTLANLRGAAGFSEPFRVRYRGVGNESWGCGGNFRPEDYASEFRRFTAWVPRYGVNLQFIGSGPNGDDINWTQRFFEQLDSDHEYSNPRFVGWSVHHYAWNLARGKTRDWTAAEGDALVFDSVDWYELLPESNRIEQIIADHWAVMGHYDRTHYVKLVIDEYGPWYREGSELDPSHIFGQQITMRDALATALTLDTFNRNPEKVGMANCAQLVNNLNALFLAHEDHFIVTPNFHVFAMYSNHQGAVALRTEFSAPDVHYLRNGEPATFWGLKGSASRKQNAITLTAVNPDLARPKSVQIKVAGAKVKNVSADVLASPDVHAHNTFERPDTVQRAKLDVSVSGDLLNADLPAASVACVKMKVA
jgi:alpha-L-arabinofuranosidase